jgi:UDP-N-acetylglucosamine 2-epimerase (non-hydrolysing)
MGEKKKVLVVFGTRPDAIKMCPVAIRLKGVKSFETRVCVSGQHREMLDDVLGFFGVQPEYDLGVMMPGQDLFDITARVMGGIKGVLADFTPDCVLVHGDTTTALAAALSAYYVKAKIGHVEAGLRTAEKYSPFPEEMNRKVVCALSDFHFAPTESARKNLLKEGVRERDIAVTGNTAIDALYIALGRQQEAGFIPAVRTPVRTRLILVTAHRRESFGEGIRNVCLALRELAENNSDVTIVYPVHPNPNVKAPVEKYLSGVGNILITNPLDYKSFVYLMDKSYLILTDSGGIQEEAPSLGKPVLVLRDVTERPEAVEAGTVRIVGTDRGKIVSETQLLLDSKEEYNAIARKVNPYGDGRASEKIADFLKENL